MKYIPLPLLMYRSTGTSIFAPLRLPVRYVVLVVVIPGFDVMLSVVLALMLYASLKVSKVT